jgi:hypothetical protein
MHVIQPKRKIKINIEDARRLAKELDAIVNRHDHIIEDFKVKDIYIGLDGNKLVSFGLVMPKERFGVYYSGQPQTYTMASTYLPASNIGNSFDIRV